MGFFSDAQGHLTPQSFVESGLIQTRPRYYGLSSLPANMKKIQSKMKALSCY